jgi:NADH dehydrogenase
LVEAGPRVLPSFPADLSDYTKRILSDIGVEVLTGLAVTDCDDQGVSLASGERIESACETIDRIGQATSAGDNAAVAT